MIEFNGVTSDSFADILSIQRISRPASSGARAHTLDIAGRAGVYYFGKDRKPENVNFRLLLKSNSIAERRTAVRAIAAWLDTEDPKVLSFTDEPTLIYYAVLVDPIPVEEFALVGYVDVTFLIPDGCAYSASLNETSSVSGDCYYNNEGNLDTPVIIEATIEEADVEELIISLTDYVFVKIEYEFDEDDEVVINTQTGRVTINGDNNDKYVTYDSSPFFMLPPGAGKITPVPASTSLKMTFRECFK